MILVQDRKWKMKLCHSVFLPQRAEPDTTKEVSENKIMSD